MPREQLPTGKQARFIAEYLKDLNGTEAAVRAGYRESSARHTASRLLQKPHIKAEVQRLQAEQLDKAGITAQGVLEQLRRIAYLDPAVIYDENGSVKNPRDWPVAARTALTSFDVVRNRTAADGLLERVVKVRLESKLQALEMLAKHFGLLRENVDVNQEITIRWLEPEPAPALPDVVVEAERGAPPRLTEWAGPVQEPTDRMGFDVEPPRCGNRTHADILGDVQGDPSSSVFSEEDAGITRSGISRKRQERIFPELRRRS